MIRRFLTLGLLLGGTQGGCPPILGGQPRQTAPSTKTASENKGQLVKGGVVYGKPQPYPAAPKGRRLVSRYTAAFAWNGIGTRWPIDLARIKAIEEPSPEETFRTKAEHNRRYVLEFVRADGSTFSDVGMMAVVTNSDPPLSGPLHMTSDDLNGAVGLRVYDRDRKHLLAQAQFAAADPDLDSMSLVQGITGGTTPKLQITWRVPLLKPNTETLGKESWAREGHKAPGFDSASVFVSWDEGKTWSEIHDPAQPLGRDQEAGTYTLDVSLEELERRRFITPQFALVASLHWQLYIKYYLPHAQGNRAYLTKIYK